MAIGSYTFQTVTVPGATDGTWLGGINNAGVVSGSYVIPMPSDVNPHSFTEAGGVITDLGERTPGQATGAINNARQVVGTRGSPVSGFDGFLWSNGTTQLIMTGPTFGQVTRAFGVNDGDVVVGSHRNSAHAGEQAVGFTWQDGTISLFQVPGAAATEAHGINNGGTIVGSADSYGFIDAGGQFGLFGLGQITEVNAINNTGAVVGDFFDGTHWHGFIDAAGQVTTIDAPSAVNTHITGINDDNTIVGYFDAGGPAMGFIATDPPPADPVKTMVREDYVGLFGRDADPGAQTLWANLLKAGAMTPRDFVWALTQSAEGQWLHGGQTGEQFVNSVYMNALGRPAESNTQTAWAGVMRAGAGSWDVLSAISTSLEGSMHFAATHGS